MKFYNTTGIVNYKKDGWVVIDIDRSVVEYYKWWVERFTWKKVSTPHHGAHITVLPAKHNGNFTNHPLWMRRQGERVNVVYDPTVYCNEFVVEEKNHKGQLEKFKANYFWLVVECPVVGEIRQSFGLEPKLKFRPHITIAYLRH